MIVIRKQQGRQYKIAFTDYGLAVVNEANSWPVMLTGPVSWICEHDNLPKYVKCWLNELCRKQDWYIPKTK